MPRTLGGASPAMPGLCAPIPDAMMSAVGISNNERGAVGHGASYAVARGTRSLARQRLLVRKSGAGWPYVWRGLLPSLALTLLGWYAMGPFARHEIEDNVRRSITQAFADKGLGEVVVSVSGQQVLLTGHLAPGVNTRDALDIARAATCPTWLGPQPCAQLVIGQFTDLPAAEQASPSAPAAAAPNAAALDMAAPQAAASQAAGHEACERALAAVVERERIEFDPGSARLAGGSARVLDAIARAQGGCRDVVRIEGHSDNRGDASANRRLSLARAQAVRAALIERGVPAERLLAEGLGDSRPIADNASADGRRQNRRIEFRVATPG